MIILAIDTSCDETSAAVLDRDRVLSSVTWSQIKYHRRWGGVVPFIARRAHEQRLPLVVSRALRLAGITNNSITNELISIFPVTAIAVTVGPGLAPALEAGIHYAKELALLHKIPLIPVNHLEGHIASVFLRRKSGVPFSNLLTFQPSSHFLSLIVSGGHTELTMTHMRHSHPERPSFSEGVEGSRHGATIFDHQLLGQTLDDAAGECLDKVGRELGLGYPAGPVVEQLARQGNSQKYKFPIPLQRSPRADLNFSFSGLKTAAIQMIHGSHHIEKAGKRMGEIQQMSDFCYLSTAKVRHLSKNNNRQQLYDFCASFQEAVIDALLFKLKRAIQITGIKTVILTGGVAANNLLRRRAAALVRSLGGNFYPAPKQFTGDNAAMIGLAAHWALARGEAAKTETEINAIDRQPNLNFVIPSAPPADGSSF